MMTKQLAQNPNFSFSVVFLFLLFFTCMKTLSLVTKKFPPKVLCLEYREEVHEYLLIRCFRPSSESSRLGTQDKTFIFPLQHVAHEQRFSEFARISELEFSDTVFVLISASVPI